MRNDIPSHLPHPNRRFELGQTGGLAGLWQVGAPTDALGFDRLLTTLLGKDGLGVGLSPCEVDDVSVLEEHPLQPREPQHLREPRQPQRPQDLVVRSLHRVGHVPRA